MLSIMSQLLWNHSGHEKSHLILVKWQFVDVATHELVVLLFGDR